MSIVTVVQTVSYTWPFVTPRTAAGQASLSSGLSWSLLKFISIESVILFNISLSATLFSFGIQSFPASGSFPMSRLFASGGWSIGASASGLPMDVQGCFPLRLTGWISLQSKGLSRVFSNTTVRKHRFFSAQPSLWSNFRICTCYWKNHSFDCIWIFVGKVMSLLFNMLSRFFVAFLPRRKHLLISWLQSPFTVILEPKKLKSLTVSIFSPSIFHKVMWPDAMILVFWMLSFKPAFSLSSFTFIKRLCSSSLLSVVRVVSSACQRLLIFLPQILIPACASSSPAFCMMYSACKLHKQGCNIQPWRTPFPIWNQSVDPCLVLTIASWSAYRFLRRQVRWSGIPISLRYFQFVVLHKSVNVVNEGEVDVFLEVACFFCDPVDVGNLISGPSAFPKSSLYIWKFLVPDHLLKTTLEDFEHSLDSLWSKYNCTIVWTFFASALLWNWNENWDF